MARKTFISYKYNEASETRDKIIEALGDDARYYQGETSTSPNMTDTSTENIKEALKNMIYSTSVLIVIISPQIKSSRWIDWEICYALKNQKRGDQNSTPNRIIGVIQNNNGYDWFKEIHTNSDGCISSSYKSDLVYPIINNNRMNAKVETYCCDNCRTIDWWEGSYISYITEEDFLTDCSEFIEKTYNKNSNNYDLTKQL